MILALLLSTCAQIYTCPKAPPCFRTVTSENPLDAYACRNLTRDIKTILKGFERHHIASGKDVCDMLGLVDLHIMSEQTQWVNDSLGMVRGRFSWQKNYMEVARDLYSLSHETLHAWEFNRTLLDSFNMGESPGAWDKNKTYTQMMDEYEDRAKPCDRETWRITW